MAELPASHGWQFVSNSRTILKCRCCSPPMPPVKVSICSVLTSWSTMTCRGILIALSSASGASIELDRQKSVTCGTWWLQGLARATCSVRCSRRSTRWARHTWESSSMCLEEGPSSTINRCVSFLLKPFAMVICQRCENAWAALSMSLCPTVSRLSSMKERLSETCRLSQTWKLSGSSWSVLVPVDYSRVILRLLRDQPSTVWVCVWKRVKQEDSKFTVFPHV